MTYDPLAATTTQKGGSQNGDPLAATTVGGSPQAPASPMPPLRLNPATISPKQLKGLLDTSLKPLTFSIGTIGATLGAPQRGVASEIGQAPKNPRGVMEMAGMGLLGPEVLLDPAARKQAGNLIYAYTHPNDSSIEDTAESVTGASKLKTNRSDLLGKAQNFGVDLGFQTVTDPLTYASGGIGKGIGLGLDAIGEGLNALARVSPKVKATLDFIRPNALVRNAYKGHQLNIYEGTVEAQKAVARKVALNDETLLNESQQYLKALKKNDPITSLPDPLYQRVEQLLSETKVPFPKKGTMIDRLDRFFQKAQAAERENRIKATVQAHGLKYIQNPKNIGEALKNIPILGPMAQATSHTLTGLSNAGKNTMFINSLPHMANVGIAQWLGSGIPGVIGGLRRAVTKDLGEFGNELERYGATSHFSAREPSAIERNTGVLGKIATKTRAVSQGALDRFETGMRAQRYNQLRRQGMDAFDAAAQVRKELFDYTNTSGLSRLLSEGGAPFPQYRLNAIPTMGLNALRNAPQRLNQYARVENLTNQDLIGKNKPYGVDFGKPPDLFAQMLDPLGIINYALSPSTIGLAGSAIQQLRNPVSIGKALMSAAAYYVPGVSPLVTIEDWQKFPSKAPKQLRELLSQFGSYTKNKPTPKKGTVYF